jgi:hypothetical protein
MIYILIRLRNILSLNHIKTVYYALIQSIMQYGIIGWGGAYTTNLHPLFIIQKKKKIAKIIFKKPRTYPSKFVFKELGVLSIK